MLFIYSKEPFEDILIDKGTSFNGDILKTVSVNRQNRNSDIYIKLSATSDDKRVIPKVYRGYYRDDGSLKYHSMTYPIVTLGPTETELLLEYDMFNDYNYVTYRVQFEVITHYTTLEISEMGVIFKDMELSLDNTYSIGTNLSKDINGNPLYDQEYYEGLSFSIITNRTNIQTVLNVLEKPYYLVDIKDGCIDNSSDELIEDGISSSYITNATKMININISNIVGE